MAILVLLSLHLSGVMSSLVFFLSGGTLLLISESFIMTSFFSSTDLLSYLMLWLSGSSLMSAYLASGLISLVSLWWSMSLVVCFSFVVDKLLMFYVLFELSLIPILLMLLFLGSQPERLSAGVYFLMYTLILSLPFVAISLMFVPNHNFHSMESVEVSSALTLLMTGLFLVKMPVMGLHFWLPKAHVEANTSGSMILAGLLLKLGSYGLTRMWALLTLSLLMWTSGLWLILAVMSSVVTLIQSDLKKFVAYSSIAHMTFMVVGLISNSKLVFHTVIMMSLAHGWASMAMFNLVGAMSHGSQSRLEFFSYWESSLHWLMALLGILLLVNTSVPPLPSFHPEVLMVFFIKSSWSWGVFIFVLLSFFVCYYNAFLFLVLSHKKSLLPLTSHTYMMEALTTASLLILSGCTLSCLSLY